MSDKRLLLAICICGVLLRLYIYFKGFSFWCDEGALALNLLERGYLGLFEGLDNLQVAPPIFLVCSKFLMNMFNQELLRDFVLRLIPMVSGIAAIPFFYAFLKNYTKSKSVIFVSLFLFAFNVTAVFYCAQFKQYSTELFVSVLLIFIFYKILFKNIFKYYYLVIIFLAPWFSLSSFFIIGSNILIMLFTQRNRNLLKICASFCVSFLIFYFAFFKSVSAVNYEGMRVWWENGYGFIDFRHPTRMAIRLGDLFYFNKIQAVLCSGMVLFSILNNYKHFCSKRTLFIYLPIILTFIASALHLYPLQARLILFLLPLFVIVIAEYNWKIRNIYLIIICFMCLERTVHHLMNPFEYYTITDARQAVKIVNSNIKPEEKIVLEKVSSYVYLYYLNNKKEDVVILQTFSSNTEKSPFENLPSRRYYIMSKEENIDISSDIKVLKNYGLHSTLLYVEKQ